MKQGKVEEKANQSIFYSFKNNTKAFLVKTSSGMKKVQVKMSTTFSEQNTMWLQYKKPNFKKVGSFFKKI